jgi:hypothetical protein
MTVPDAQKFTRRVVQTSFVVKNVYESAQGFLDLYGIGPWFVFEHLPMKELKYKGSLASTDFTLAVAFSGTLMIELVQQNDDTPSAYKDLVDKRGYGFHHFAVQSHDYESDLARYRKLGFIVANEGTSPDAHGGGRAAYVDTTTRLPGMTEVMEVVPELVDALREFELAAANWDGTDPIRVHRFD